MKEYLEIFGRGSGGEDEQLRLAAAPGPMVPRGVSGGGLKRIAIFNAFDILPTSSTVPLKTVGTGSEAIALNTAGGVSITTAGSDNDSAAVTANAGAWANLYSDYAPEVVGKLIQTGIVTKLVQFGMIATPAEDVAAAIVAANFAGFVFDPAQEVFTEAAYGVTAAQAANWLAVCNSATVVNWCDTGIKVGGSTSYQLGVELERQSRMAHYFIDGVEVAKDTDSWYRDVSTSADPVVKGSAVPATATQLSFVAAVQAGTGAAREISLRWIGASRIAG